MELKDDPDLLINITHQCQKDEGKKYYKNDMDQIGQKGKHGMDIIPGELSAEKAVDCQAGNRHFYMACVS